MSESNVQILRVRYGLIIVHAVRGVCIEWVCVWVCSPPLCVFGVCCVWGQGMEIQKGITIVVVVVVVFFSNIN